MIKMRAPEGLTAFAHQGHPIAIDDGVVHIDERHRGDFEAHGFFAEGEDDPRPAVQAPATAAAPLDLRKRALLDAYARHLDTLSDAEVDAAVARLGDADGRAALFDDEEDADGPGATFDAARVTLADLDDLKRPQLFAVLRRHGVPAIPPISNDALREKARAALQA